MRHRRETCGHAGWCEHKRLSTQRRASRTQSSSLQLDAVGVRLENVAAALHEHVVERALQHVLRVDELLDDVGDRLAERLDGGAQRLDDEGQPELLHDAEEDLAEDARDGGAAVALHHLAGLRGDAVPVLGTAGLLEAGLEGVERVLEHLAQATARLAGDAPRRHVVEDLAHVPERVEEAPQLVVGVPQVAVPRVLPHDRHAVLARLVVALGALEREVVGREDHLEGLVDGAEDGLEQRVEVRRDLLADGVLGRLVRHLHDLRLERDLRLGDGRHGLGDLGLDLVADLLDALVRAGPRGLHGGDDGGVDLLLEGVADLGADGPRHGELGVDVGHHGVHDGLVDAVSDVLLLAAAGVEPAPDAALPARAPHSVAEHLRVDLVVGDVERGRVPAAVVEDVAPGLVLVGILALQEDAVARRVGHLEREVGELLGLGHVVDGDLALLGELDDLVRVRVVDVADDAHAGEVHGATDLLALLLLVLGLPVVDLPVAADDEEALVPLLEVLGALEHVARLAVRRVGLLLALEELPLGALSGLLLLLHRLLGHADDVHHRVVLGELLQELLHDLLRLRDLGVERRTRTHGCWRTFQ
mmetsp:Transcript_20002/g.62106  ORF Transcript_20002/g.62106 Transcript_20002/m.62106 type:complete len:588 (-) Transcript_20002:39-1802(-)